MAERADADSRERDALHELAEFCRPYGVRIAFENIFTTEPGQYRQTPTELAQTVRALGHPNLVALIDFSHAYIESTYRGLNFIEELRAMASVAGHLHVRRYRAEQPESLAKAKEIMALNDRGDRVEMLSVG